MGGPPILQGMAASQVGEGGGLGKVVIHRLGSSQLFGFPRSATTNWHKPGGLTQPIHILSQFWRLEVQNPGAGKAHASRVQTVPRLSYLVVLPATLVFLGL